MVAKARTNKKKVMRDVSVDNVDDWCGRDLTNKESYLLLIVATITLKGILHRVSSISFIASALEQVMYEAFKPYNNNPGLTRKKYFTINANVDVSL
jgi:hypothetical protein